MAGQNAHLLPKNQEKYRTLNAHKWWEKGFTGSGVKVLIIAQGAYNAQAKGYVTNVNTPINSVGSYHEGDFIIHQIAPDADIYSINIFSNTDGTNNPDRWTLLQALQWALDNDVDVIVAPFTTSIWDWYEPNKKHEYLSKQLRDKGVLMFGSSGNESRRNIPAPAGSQYWVAVGGYEPVSNPNGGAGYNNYGPEMGIIMLTSFVNQIRPPDLNIPNDEGDYVPISHTSGTMGPIGGLAALLKQAYPSMDLQGFYQYCQQHCDSLGQTVWNEDIGYGFFKLAPTAPDLEGGEDLPEFTDVEPNRWSLPYIQSMVQKGIMNGYPDGTFKPTNTVSREEIAKIIDSTINYIMNNR